MFRGLFLSLAVVAMLALAGTSTAQARGCHRGGGGYGGYGGGYAPVYRSSHYHGGGHGYHRAPSVYHRSHYGGGYPAYYGGGYRGGYRSGVSLSFGF